MAATIPLVRCGSIMPLVRWMQENDRPVEESLRAVDLGYVLKADAYLPIPLGPALAFLRNASVDEGPDLPLRVVSSTSVGELGLIGKVALGGGSVHAALFHVAEALPRQVSHETISVRALPNGLIVRQITTLRIDDETRHALQLYFAALIQALCANACSRFPMFQRVAMLPHPVHGLSHLRPSFANTVEASADKSLELFVPSRVADSLLPDLHVDTEESGAITEHPPLHGDGSLGASVRLVIAAMLHDGAPTVERVAAAGGLSVRTLQRRLGEEGTSFSRLLEAIRHDLALAGISKGMVPDGELAARLGYEQQSSFSRAVRRWTGSSPNDLRRRRNT